MSLVPGSRLGPYEIIRPIGAGGMGEVFLARDPRLSRDVAIKVLPTAVSKDPEMVKRLELEAKVAGTLNHPNIVAVFDIGSHDGTLYVVSEFLEGTTLRERLKTDPPSSRKALEYALEIARGLAAAHEKGIIHRDLKPENIFLTRDGRVKILDFGLAKLHPQSPKGEATQSIMAGDPLTEQGLVTGTVGYMSPEQVRGHAIDPRSDIFAFGSVLYELLTEQRAFRGGSPVETMNAILKEDPPGIAGLRESASYPIERLVRRCLEKRPDERFQSARDLSFAIEGLLSGYESGPVENPPAIEKRPRRRSRFFYGGFVLGGGLGLLAGWALSNHFLEPAVFRQLTGRRGTVLTGRLSPSGKEVFFAAAWDGGPVESVGLDTETLIEHPLGRPAGFEVTAVGPAGSLLFLSPGVGDRFMLSRGRSQSVPELLTEGISEADASQDGTKIAILRVDSGRSRLEFPIGTTILDTDALINFVAVSAKGDRVAYFGSPARSKDVGNVELIELRGARKTLSRGWTGVSGVRWARSGREVFFSVYDRTGATTIRAVNLSGNERVVLTLPGRFSLLDAGDNRLLLRQDLLRSGMAGFAQGESGERDLSWWGASVPRDMSKDGSTVLFSEMRGGSAVTPAIFMRRIDGSPARFLGSGTPFTLAPDGRFVLAQVPGSVPRLELVPTGAGEVHSLVTEGIVRFENGWWFPDNKRILFLGAEPGQRPRLYVEELELTVTKPRSISPPGVELPAEAQPLSPDGKVAFAFAPDGVFTLYPTDGGDPRPGPALQSGEWPLRFTADSQSLYVARGGAASAPVERVDLSSGKREIWKTLAPGDLVGLKGRLRILLTADGMAYVYGYERDLSELFVVYGAL